MTGAPSGAGPLMMAGPDVARTAAEALSFARRLEVPAASTHRLTRLAAVLAADEAAGRPSYAADLMELRAIVDVLTGSWERDLAGSPVGRETLRDPDQFDHQILVLATVRVLRSWNNSAEVMPEGPGGDAAIDSPPVRVLVEVKAPCALAERASRPDPISADELVKDALDKSRDQRRGRASVVLVQAGFRVPLVELDDLASAWSRALRRPTRAAIAAGLAITVGLALGDIRIRTRPRSAATRPVGAYERFAAELDPELFALGVATRVGRNATYSGSAPIIRLNDPRVGIRLPESPR